MVLAKDKAADKAQEKDKKDTKDKEQDNDKEKTSETTTREKSSTPQPNIKPEVKKETPTSASKTESKKKDEGKESPASKKKAATSKENGQQPNGKDSSKKETSPDEKERLKPEYDKMKKELKELINKKRTLDRSLNSLEEQIYKFEGSYLEDSVNGNIIKGFENYNKSNPNKRRAVISEDDRLFSLSSAVFLKKLRFGTSYNDSSSSSSANTTREIAEIEPRSTTGMEMEPPKLFARSSSVNNDHCDHDYTYNHMQVCNPRAMLTPEPEHKLQKSNYRPVVILTDYGGGYYDDGDAFLDDVNILQHFT